MCIRPCFDHTRKDVSPPGHCTAYNMNCPAGTQGLRSPASALYQGKRLRPYSHPAPVPDVVQQSAMAGTNDHNGFLYERMADDNSRPPSDTGHNGRRPSHQDGLHVRPDQQHEPRISFQQWALRLLPCRAGMHTATAAAPAIHDGDDARSGLLRPACGPFRSYGPCDPCASCADDQLPSPPSRRY